MSSKGLFAGVFLICLWAFSEAQSNCKGRCGMGYYRGHTCQCDFSCVLYGECCKDYERLCTSKNSCKGRCGEAFKRGRICNCDADCAKYNQCCPDFTAHCEEMEEVEGEAPEKPESCDKNVQKKPTELAPDATEQPGGSEGDDPGDNLIPTVNPTSYQNDDPDSASKQTGDVPDTSPLPESSTSEPPLPDLDGFEIFPEPPEITVFQDETTETPMTTASQDETTETPMTTASQDETTETPMTTASQDETTETPMTTASQDETTETPMTTASQDETTETPMTTASQEEITETPMTTASQKEITETPTTSASPDETEPPTTTASQEETTEISTTTASQEETTPSSTTTVPSTTEVTATEVTATEVTATEVTATEVTANRDADDTTVAPEPTDPQTNKPTNEPTVPPSETPETTTSLPESTESTAATELTTIFPTTANKETTSVPEMTTAELSTLAPVSEVSTAAEDTATAKQPDVTQSSNNAPSSKPAEKPIPERPFQPDPENKPVLNGLDDLTEYPADDSNDMNLCSGRPISGVTTLSNGTVVVFRGHFFWVLDRNRVPGPAQGITQVWGIPSPIDTVFTRCNCQAKTYIFKGPQYWRYENDALDPGYPKVIHTGFDGLRGHITAALSVPQYNRRRESVYFFKRGGNVQKYSYQFNPTCGRKVHYAVYTHRNRVARQAPAHASLLEPTINYRSSWTGFPTTITAAVSIPNKREPEGYNYYVFSRAKSYKIRIEGDRPVLAAAKPSPMPQSNEVFKCPRKLSK